MGNCNTRKDGAKRKKKKKAKAAMDNDDAFLKAIKEETNTNNGHGEEKEKRKNKGRTELDKEQLEAEWKTLEEIVHKVPFHNLYELGAEIGRCMIPLFSALP